MSVSISFLFVALATGIAADAAPAASPAEQLAALTKEGTAIHDNFYAELKLAKQDQPRVIAANDKYHADTAAWAARAEPLIRAHPAEPAALDVIIAMAEYAAIDDGFVAILSPDHRLQYATYLGGTGQERISVIRAASTHAMAHAAPRQAKL